jgi:hypothetical protein
MHMDIDQQKEALAARLRELPDEMQPPCDWQEFKARSKRFPAAVAGRKFGWSGVAVAAAGVVVVCGMAIWGRIDRAAHDFSTGTASRNPDVASQYPDVASANPDSASENLSRASPNHGTDSEVFSPATERSEALESWLASLPQEPVVVRVGTRSAAAGLEDRIAQVDDLLSSVRLTGTPQDRLSALQQERIRLVGSLAQVRYAEMVAAE